MRYQKYSEGGGGARTSIAVENIPILELYAIPISSVSKSLSLPALLERLDALLERLCLMPSSRGDALLERLDALLARLNALLERLDETLKKKKTRRKHAKIK